jgi:hypothetical protein
MNASALQREAISSEPNFEVVVEKVSNLSSLIGWAARKVDLTVNEFCKGFGSTLGKAAAVALPVALLKHTYWGEIVGLTHRMRPLHNSILANLIRFFTMKSMVNS